MTSQNRKWIIGGIIALVVVSLIGWFIGVNNSFRQQNNDIDYAWSDVENSMQRRYELIPSLVDSVKGSMKHEDKVFSNITEARKEYAGAKTPEAKVAANDKMTQSVGTMINAIGENYPELKSNDNVKTLMTQLEGTENRLTQSRRKYNEEVKHFNQRVVTFPSSIIAGIDGYHTKPYLKSDEAAKTMPKIDFGE